MSAELTDQEKALLLFPGSVPGVPRLGSVVIHEGCRWVVVAIGGWPPALGDDGDGNGVGLLIGRSGELKAVEACDVSLDLTDPTGRAHLAWWLCQKFDAGELYSPFGVEYYPGDERPYMLLFGTQDVLPAKLHDEMCEMLDEYPVAFHSDHRRLPGGSRLVDALALSLVARHVAGLVMP